MDVNPVLLIAVGLLACGMVGSLFQAVSTDERRQSVRVHRTIHK